MKINYFFLLLVTFCLQLTFNKLTAQISTNDLLAYYTFDNSVVDSGPSGYNGTMNGGVFVDDEDGNALSALQLNGISDFVNITSFANSFRSNLGEMTIYFKLKFIDEVDDQTVLSLGNEGESMSTNVFEVEYENNRYQIETETGTNAVNHELEIDITGAIFNQSWNEYAIILSNNTVTYLRNGELIYCGTYTPAETTCPTMFVGCFAGTDIESCCFMGGIIDNLQFYDRAMNRYEIFGETRNSVGIGTETPDISAKLEINSEEQGLLIPRMTSEQRMCIVSPAEGLLVFDTTTSSFWFMSSSGWRVL